MSFGSPYLLVALIVVPLVAIVYRRLERRREERAERWSNPALLPNTVTEPPGRRRHLPLMLFLLGLTLLLVGFARPKRDVVTDVSNAPTVAFVFDVSGSMAANDVGTTRLQAARDVALRLLHELPSDDRVAVVTFGDVVRVVVPPTTNHATVAAHLPTRITPKAGTSLGDGITAGVSVVVQGAGENIAGNAYPGLVLLLSDGTQTAGGTTPASAADTAFVERVPVDTVTIGTSHGTVTQAMQVDGFNTKVNLSVPADPATMQQIAHQAAGTAYTVASAEQAASAAPSFASLSGDVRSSSGRETRVQQLSAVLGGAALVALLAGFLVSGFWYGRVA
jgi:Ca-activated chloride channel homolog